jgi:DNA-binding CsgD family transcriptional regulator
MPARSSTSRPTPVGVRLTSRSNDARFETLYTLFARLAACDDLDSVLREVLEASMDVVGGDAGYIRMFDLDESDPITSRYPFVVHKGISEDYLQYFGRLVQPVSNTARQAVYEGFRVFIEDMTSHPSFEPHRDIVVAEGYRTLQATPMMSRNGSKCVGVICTYFRDVQTPPVTSFETLDLYAEIAARIIDNYRQVADVVARSRSTARIAKQQAEVLHWAEEQLNGLAESVSQLEPEEVVQRSRLIASRLKAADSEGPAEVKVPNEQGELNPYGLLPRELDVLINVWRGLSDQESAARMGVSRFTVAKYLASAMRKLNVETRSQVSILVGRDILAGDSIQNMSFADALRSFRQRAGMTQAELAEKAGLSYRTISDLERGIRTKVYTSTLNLLCTALDLEPADATRIGASVDRSRKSRLGSQHI